MNSDSLRIYMDPDSELIYKYYRENRGKFQGRVWLPCLDVTCDDRSLLLSFINQFGPNHFNGFFIFEYGTDCNFLSDVMVELEKLRFASTVVSITDIRPNDVPQTFLDEARDFMAPIKADAKLKAYLTAWIARKKYAQEMFDEETIEVYRDNRVMTAREHDRTQPSPNVSRHSPTISQYRLSMSPVFRPASIRSPAVSRLRMPSMSPVFRPASIRSPAVSRLRMPSISPVFRPAAVSSIRPPAVSSIRPPAVSVSRLRMPSTALTDRSMPRLVSASQPPPPKRHRASAPKQDFGEAIYSKTRILNGKTRLLVWESANDKFYTFRRNNRIKRKGGGFSDCYLCRQCEGANVRHKNSTDQHLGTATTVVQLTDEDDPGRVTKDPEDGHSPFCVPLTRTDIMALDAKREMRSSCREGARPKDVYDSVLEKISLSSDVPLDNAEVVEVVQKIGSYLSNRSSLFANTLMKLPPIKDLNDIPDLYKVTLRGRRMLKMQPSADPSTERFLLWSSDVAMIYGSDTNLKVLHQSEFWIADGTFQKCPRRFVQLYTIHAFARGEGIPCVFIIMKTRLEESYSMVFKIVRDALQERFGNIGHLHTVLMDYENASRKAFRNVFGGLIRVRGCSFHFAQALNRKIKDVGLTSWYKEGKDDPKSLGDGACLFRWVKLIQGLALFPAERVRETWALWLRNIPHCSTQLMRGKLLEFRDYVESTWIRCPEEWNHFGSKWRTCERLCGRPGPRTTNTAEGWHGRLNFLLGVRRPQLKVFITWLQRAEHANQIRYHQLIAPLNPAVPKPRKPKFVTIDRRIAQAEQRFLAAPPPLFIPASPPNRRQNRSIVKINPAVSAHLKHMGLQLWGEKDKKKKKQTSEEIE